jgi:hypothetical protein
MSVYGGLIRLYPRDFREEYGPDMEQLLRDQLRDENAARVWGRAVLDLALTIPPQHLETHMKNGSAPVVYGIAAVVSLVVAAVAGSAIGVSLLGIGGVLVFGTLAAVALRRSRTLGEGTHAAAHWWKYLAAGAAGVATVAVIGSQVDELPDGTWFLFMAALLASVVVLAVGLVLGLVRLAGRRTA